MKLENGEAPALSVIGYTAPNGEEHRLLILEPSKNNVPSIWLCKGVHEHGEWVWPAYDIRRMRVIEDEHGIR